MQAHQQVQYIIMHSLYILLPLHRATTMYRGVLLLLHTITANTEHLHVVKS